MNLFAAASAPGSTVRNVVVKSSTLVYGASPKDPVWFSEETRRAEPPRSMVERSLLEVEGYVRDFAVDNPHVTVAMLRFSNVLGPDITTPLAKALELPLVPSMFGFDPRFQFVHETDVVRAILYVLEHQVQGIYNVAGDGLLPWSEVAAICGKRTVPLPADRHRPAHRARWPASASSSRPSCSTCCATAAASTTGGSSGPASTTASPRPAPSPTSSRRCASAAPSARRTRLPVRARRRAVLPPLPRRRPRRRLSTEPDGQARPDPGGFAAPDGPAAAEADGARPSTGAGSSSVAVRAPVPGLAGQVVEPVGAGVGVEPLEAAGCCGC